MEREYLIVLLSSFVISGIITFYIRRLALHFNIVDNPSIRKVHTKPIPLMGGLSIFIAVWGSIFLFIPEFQEISGIFLTSFIILCVGLWDDKYGMRPIIKFSAQIVVALMIYFLFNTKVLVFEVRYLNLFFTIFWIVGVINAFNLLDNMDGLASGVAGIASFYLFMISIQNGQYFVAILSAVVIGSCAGFLIHNFKPAKIFLGDAGSMLLGFLVAVLAIKIEIYNIWPLALHLKMYNVRLLSCIVPILIVGLPIFDTTLVTINRIIYGKKISEGGKDHSSHRLAKMKGSQVTSVVILYLIAFVFGLIGYIISYSNKNEFLMLMMLVLFLISIMGYELGTLPGVYFINKRILRRRRKEKSIEK